MALEEGISWSVEKETHKSWSRAVGNKIASFFYLGHLVSLLAGEFSKEDYGINRILYSIFLMIYEIQMKISRSGV